MLNAEQLARSRHSGRVPSGGADSGRILARVHDGDFNLRMKPRDL
jgi:hypothetical protein